MRFIWQNNDFKQRKPLNTLHALYCLSESDSWRKTKKKEEKPVNFQNKGNPALFRGNSRFLTLDFYQPVKLDDKQELKVELLSKVGLSYGNKQEKRRKNR